MNSQKNENIINISINRNQNHQKTKITSGRTDFVSNAIQSISPNSDSNLMSTEKGKNINAKKEEKNKRKIINNSKPLTNYTLDKKDKNEIESKNKINQEIFSYFNHNSNSVNPNFSQAQILHFLLSRLDKDKTLKCNILLNNNNFILYSNQQKFILCAKEEFSIFHKNYNIYTSRDFTDGSIIARLHSYSKKNEFILYDIGLSPAKLKNNEEKNNKNCLRRYLLQVKFMNNKKYEHFFVYLPKENFYDNKMSNADVNHKDKLNEGDNNNIYVFENALPTFDFNLHKFVQNFSYRVKEKSKYNFKIVNENKTVIECGKVNDLNYILDISYPFSPLEAFAVAISVFVKNS